MCVWGRKRGWSATTNDNVLIFSFFVSSCLLQRLLCDATFNQCKYYSSDAGRNLHVWIHSSSLLLYDRTDTDKCNIRLMMLLLCLIFFFYLMNTIYVYIYLFICASLTMTSKKKRGSFKFELLIFLFFEIQINKIFSFVFDLIS